MKLFTPKKKTIKNLRRKKVNPHKFWNMFVVVFMMGLIITIVGMTLFFTKTVQSLDAVVLPRLDVGKRPVEKIRQRVERAEKAVNDRVGEPEVIEEEILPAEIEE
jgi:hypothetical protein